MLSSISDLRARRVAVIHDWLVVWGGAERVLEQILKVVPQADVFTVVDFLPPAERRHLGKSKVKSSFIQRLPGAQKRYRSYLPLMPLAIEQLDMSAYDLVISSSHAVAKGVLTGPNQMHVSYVHSPMRYAWDLQHQYLRESGLDQGAKGLMARWLLHKMRLWDLRSASGVDWFIANSAFVKRRIEGTYRRDAEVIYPPVDVGRFTLRAAKEDFYLTASRQVPYKRIDLIVEAFTRMKDKKLVVIGDGPEFESIKAKAGPNVTMMGHQPNNVMVSHMQRARGFVFAAEEDFGISPVEAQACGTPVICFGRGGALETIRGTDHEAPTGVFFEHQTCESLIDAVLHFERHSRDFDPFDCRTNALRFAPEIFRAEFTAFLTGAMQRNSYPPRVPSLGTPSALLATYSK